MTRYKFGKFLFPCVLVGLSLFLTMGCERPDRSGTQSSSIGYEGVWFDDYDDGDLFFYNADDVDLDFNDLVYINRPRCSYPQVPNEAEIFYIKEEIKSCDEAIAQIQKEIDYPEILFTQKLAFIQQKEEFERLRASWTKLLYKKMNGLP